MTYPYPPISHVMWPAVAHHEAGHAVAYILGSRAIYGNNGWFKVCIRPGATGLHETNKGSEADCLGIVESPGFYNSMHSAESLAQTPYRLNYRAAAIQQMVFSLAGPFAEVIFRGEDDSEYEIWEPASGLEGSINDLEKADDVYDALRILTPHRPRYRTICDLTERLVRDNWPAIEALAARLLVKHELECDEALEIVAPFLDAQRPRLGAPMPLVFAA